LHQFADHGRDTAGAVIFLAEIGAGRLQVDKQRYAVSDRLPVFDRQSDTDVTCQRVEMDRRIG
jgi:hypothetical protein